MPYVVPTAADLKTRFPEFTNVDNQIVGTFISAAANEVDPVQWQEKYYAIAIIYLAAHFMWLYQQQLLVQSQGTGGSGGGGGAGSDIQTFLSDMRWEDFEISFGSTSTGKSGSSSWLQSSWSASPLYGKTMYGQLFIELRRRNLPTVVLIG